MGTKPLDMHTVLDRMAVLVAQLQQEPWDEYDKTLTGAATIVVKRSFAELQKAAKAVARITPEESRASTIVPGFEWVGEALDSVD